MPHSVFVYIAAVHASVWQCVCDQIWRWQDDSYTSFMSLVLRSMCVECGGSISIGPDGPLIELLVTFYLQLCENDWLTYDNKQEPSCH